MWRGRTGCERVVAVTDFDPTATLTAVAGATDHLLETIADLTDDDMRAPSQLPDWTRGHVLTHIARNADGLCNMLNTVRTGVVTAMYASDEARDADIEAGSSRPAVELIADVRDSAQRFAGAFEAVGPDQWSGSAYRTPGAVPTPGYLIGDKRLIEVLVHHVDLGADYTPAHWPDSFAESQLAEIVTRFNAREDVPALRLHVEETDEWLGIQASADDESVVSVHGPRRALAAWLMGRASGDGLVTELPEGGRGSLPGMPSWG
jgi:maleylpyruvate isomerase